MSAVVVECACLSVEDSVKKKVLQEKRWCGFANDKCWPTWPLLSRLAGQPCRVEAQQPERRAQQRLPRCANFGEFGQKLEMYEFGKRIASFASALGSTTALAYACAV